LGASRTPIERAAIPDISLWIVWASLSALFAALTTIFAKVGVENVNSDLATFIRTVVIIVVLGAFLRRAATRASWRCYFRALQLGDAARVAPIDKLSVVLVAVFGVAFLGEQLTLTSWLGALLIDGGAVLIALG